MEYTKLELKILAGGLEALEGKDFYRYGHDCIDVTNGYSKDNLVCEINLSLWGHSKEIIEPMVKYFGGWYIPNDTRDDENIFYPFNTEQVTLDPVEQFVFTTVGPEFNWNDRFKILQFIKHNLGGIKNLN